MNENIDLTKILDGCPIGTKFYSILQGEVSFINIDIFAEYPIIVSVYNKHMDTIVHDSYAKDGRYNSFYDGECILFPSKDQRDWSKFERFWDKPKIEKFDIKTLQPFDKVLVRIGTNYNSGEWHIDFFEYFDEKNKMIFNLSSLPNNWVIPYNDETKHLVNTTDDCLEYYKWWEECL